MTNRNHVIEKKKYLLSVLKPDILLSLISEHNDDNYQYSFNSVASRNHIYRVLVVIATTD